MASTKLRKGHCYTKLKRAYTRKSKYKRKGYVKSVPVTRVIRYDMGDLRKKFSFKVTLNVKAGIQIRQNSLESCRLIINRHLNKALGTNYYLKLHVYPHHVLRENRMLTGAGADRMQTGMQKAFGTPVNIAAQMKKNQTLFSVKVDEADTLKAKAALQKARPRLPGSFSIEIKKI